MIFNDACWLMYLYAVFFAMLQFRQVKFDTGMDIFNFIFALVVFLFFVVFTFIMIYLGNKYKDPKVKLPRKLSFLKL